jgi:adenylosuccinate lyase
MSAIFSEHFRAVTFRRLWVALAEAQQELGLGITDGQIAELRANIENIDHGFIERKEREIRHDVMAHIHAYAEKCPTARGIIHLGATSAYVGDNTDLIQMRAALQRIQRSLINVIEALAAFARRTKDVATLAFTHFQPAQPTTVGKRACLWLQDFLLDFRDLGRRIEDLPFLGAKGATGTQASYLELFDGDEQKACRLDERVAEKMGFPRLLLVAGQTYPRKVDAQIADLLAAVAQSAHKFSNDIRLLQHLREIEEPFEDQQVGSSAMPYKRNPMRAERMAALSRYVITAAQSPSITAASQWFERTLDDSANKRLAIPEMFLATDGILALALNVARGLVVHEGVIRRHLEAELPFMATEYLLLAAVQKGGDRQALHERLREHCLAATERIVDGDGKNDLLERLASDPAFPLADDSWASLLDARRYVGRAPSQVDEFLRAEVDSLLVEHADLLGADAGLRV